MHISRVQLVNYRNFTFSDFLFRKGVNTIIGENGSGKSNFFRATRLLLDDHMVRSAFHLNENDFNRGIGNWQGHWIVISIEFDEVSEDETIQALFLHGVGNIEDAKIGKSTYNLIFRPKANIRERLSALTAGDSLGLSALQNSITIDDYETIFTGKSTANFTDPAFYKSVVGDFDTVNFPDELSPVGIGGVLPRILSVSKEISFTFVQALRDVVADFQSNRTNPLLTLLKSKSGEIDQVAFQPIVDLINNLNEKIELLPDVESVRGDINKTINDAAGQAYSPSSLSIKSDLSSESDQLFQSLKLFIGENEDGYEGGINELSLGGANLIYLTLKLLNFKYQKDKETFANFLFIEEPEAHIHTHIQKTLFDRLNYTETQIIYSTHSTQISEVSNVESINILGRVGTAYEVYQPSNGLTPQEIGNVQRYLDAIRSTLLFAKSVILVEGDAEEILVPIMIKNVLGISLDELGISLINIRSTGFKNIAMLFHGDRIRRKCAIITDADAAFFHTSPELNDTERDTKRKNKAINSQASGLARKTIIDGFCAGNSWLSAFYAKHTFEVDFLDFGNCDYAVNLVDEIYTDPATKVLAKQELNSGILETSGRRILTMADNVGKGWFAVMLGGMIDHKVVIPPYILQAFLFASGKISKEELQNIISFRLNMLEKQADLDPNFVPYFKGKLKEFSDDTLEMNGLYSEWEKYAKEDVITQILKYQCS